MDENPEELNSQVKQFVTRLLDAAGLELTAVCTINEESLHVALDGPDSDVMLREGGRLLYAVNHLVGQAFYRRTRPRYDLMVDCQDYRTTRFLELQLLAEKAAEKVRLSGRPFSLQPMPSSERRVIHLALVEQPGIRTESEGRGAYRKVVIHPQ